MFEKNDLNEDIFSQILNFPSLIPSQFYLYKSHKHNFLFFFARISSNQAQLQEIFQFTKFAI